jgi:hypothetical protein
MSVERTIVRRHAGAEGAGRVALGDADREPAVKGGAGHDRKGGRVGTAGVGAERRGLLVRGA